MRLYGGRSKGGPRVARPTTEDEEVDLVERAVAQLGELEASCSLREAEEGRRTLARIGELQGISKQSAHEALKAALRAARAHGVEVED